MSNKEPQDFQGFLDQILTKINLIRKRTLRNNVHVLDLKNIFLLFIYQDYNKKVGIFQQRLMNLNYEPKHSLFLARLLEYWARHSRWLLFAISSGMYKESMMQQRFILESWVQSYYIDLKYPDLTLKDKIELLQEKERVTNEQGRLKRKKWYGYDIFHRDYQNKTISNEIYDFNGELCNYAHGSYEELKQIMQCESESDLLMLTTPEYSKDSFNSCLRSFHQLHGYLMDLLDSFFKEKNQNQKREI